MAKNPLKARKQVNPKTAAVKTAKAKAPVLAKAKAAKHANAAAKHSAPVVLAPAPDAEAQAVWQRAQNPDPKQQFRPQADLRAKNSFRRGRFSGFGGRRAG